MGARRDGVAREGSPMMRHAQPTSRWSRAVSGDSRRESARRALSLLVCRCSFFWKSSPRPCQECGVPTIQSCAQVIHCAVAPDDRVPSGARSRGWAETGSRDGDRTARCQPRTSPTGRRVLGPRPLLQAGVPRQSHRRHVPLGLVLNGRISCVLSEVMLDAATVSQQLAVVALKSTAVAHLLSGRVTARDLVAIDAALLATVAAGRGEAMARARGSPGARAVFAMLAAILALTLLFATMTAAISDDTAVATAVLGAPPPHARRCAAEPRACCSDPSCPWAPPCSHPRYSRRGYHPRWEHARSPLEPNAAVFADMTLAVALFALLCRCARPRPWGGRRTAVRHVRDDVSSRRGDGVGARAEGIMMGT